MVNHDRSGHAATDNRCKSILVMVTFCSGDNLMVTVYLTHHIFHFRVREVLLHFEDSAIRHKHFPNILPCAWQVFTKSCAGRNCITVEPHLMDTPQQRTPTI